MEMEQLSNECAGLNPYEMATRIHGNGNERASMFYEAAFGIAILVPFTAISTDTARGAKESNNGSAKERSFEATFWDTDSAMVTR